MPAAPPRYCPRCRAIHAGKCPEAKRPAHKQTTKERGYDWAWQKFRERIKAERGICEDCEAVGQITPGIELHHKQKIKDRPDLRLDPDNVMWLCERCHDIRTARGE